MPFCHSTLLMIFTVKERILHYNNKNYEKENEEEEILILSKPKNREVKR